MCTWRSLCQNLLLFHITASVACLGGFPDSWGEREITTSQKLKRQNLSRNQLDSEGTSVPLKIPSKVLRSSTGRLYKLTCLYTGTAVTRTFAPFATISLFIKHQLPVPAPPPVLAASTSEHSLSSTDRPQPRWHQPLSQSHPAPRSRRRGASTRFACLMAGNLRQRGGEQLG